jgi:hypothetical protein
MPPGGTTGRRKAAVSRTKCSLSANTPGRGASPQRSSEVYAAATPRSEAGPGCLTPRPWVGSSDCAWTRAEELWRNGITGTARPPTTPGAPSRRTARSCTAARQLSPPPCPACRSRRPRRTWAERNTASPARLRDGERRRDQDVARRRLTRRPARRRFPLSCRNCGSPARSP